MKLQEITIQCILVDNFCIDLMLIYIEIAIKNFPNCVHKLNKKQLAKIKDTLINSNVDYLYIGVMLHDVQCEVNKASMNPDWDMDFRNHLLPDQA